jgi:quercetin dioxygenase-like cupin family protein
MRIAFLLLSASLASAAAGTMYVAAQGTPQNTRVEILHRPMSDVANKDFVVVLAEVPPGGVVAKHFHPGDETIYMLQGALDFESADHEPFLLKTGEIAYIPAKHIHEAKNKSATETAKALISIIAEKGQPSSIVVQ